MRKFCFICKCYIHHSEEHQEKYKKIHMNVIQEIRKKYLKETFIINF